jgi:3',5'-cyclic AMP phosphodiesterase CpdA
MEKLMKTMRLIIPVLMLLAFAACNKMDQDFKMEHGFKGNDGHLCFDGHKLKIAVLSDLHYMDPSLLKADGTAFQMYLMQDPKLLAESGAILKQIIQRLLIEKPDLVLISGDLTKDGELVSHKSLIKQLKLLEVNHIKVLVVPGNHDINNPDAKLFDGDNAISVPTITPEDFISLYRDFGYSNTISKDQASLSYVSEPFKGVRVLAFDANEYYNNTPEFCVVAGNIKDETMEWAKQQLAEAKEKGITVIGMMHHGVVEHFMGESVIFPDYLVDNWELKAQELMNSGLKIIFTGHFHANDASQVTSGDLSLVDVETGSPVIYDSPFRMARLENNTLYITTRHVEHIAYPMPKGVSFHDYEKEFSLQGIEVQARYMLMSPPYGLLPDAASQISPVFADAMLSHLAGDEMITPEAEASIQEIGALSTDLAGILLGLYTDLPPSDNELIVDLNK